MHAVYSLAIHAVRLYVVYSLAIYPGKTICRIQFNHSSW
jgi:hypothetical protein